MTKTVNLGIYNKGNYSPVRGKMILSLWFILNVLIMKNPLNPCGKLKIVALKLFGAKIGKNVIIKPSVSIKYPWNLSIGNNSWVGESVWIDNLGQVDIGENVCISQGAMLISGSHDYRKISFDLIVKKIVIEEGVWICAKAIVCAGVTLKSHCVISAGSVIRRNTEAYWIYAGNEAAKKIKREIV